MADAELRRLEARWRATPSDDGLAERLVTACRRAGRDPPWRALRGCERWRRLNGFVQKWFRRPLVESDGVLPRDLDDAADKRGWREPLVLREWFQLVGNRNLTATEEWTGFKHTELRSEQANTLLHMEGITEDGAMLWAVREGQMQCYDPPVQWSSHDVEAGKSSHLLPQPLSEFLFSLVLRVYLGGTQYGVEDPHHRSRSAFGAGFDAHVCDGNALQAYQRLPLVFYSGPEPGIFLGDADTLIFVDRQGGLEAAARTEASWKRLLTALPTLHPLAI